MLQCTKIENYVIVDTITGCRNTPEFSSKYVGNPKFHRLIFILLWLIVLYLHMLVIFVSYPLLIGKGSVINTAPLFLISLLPSALFSVGAWLLKRFAFNHSRDEDHSSVEEGKK